ncbi:sugar phosphate isomerase/epimerase family protein [Paenibacillus sp. TAB 01]|uniref:sugar phosphate isomerase/epimerase family protein n=1 Tax=Paenibacillus sp. TAB 01 TaxID=3368988 RepID=UPI0037534EA7
MTSLGWCMGIDHAEELKTIGYDYIECMLAPFMQESEDAFKKSLQRYLDSPLPVEAWNVLFPGDLRLVGPDVQPDRVHSYVSKAVETVARIGSSIIVFGSGRSRNVPDGWARERAEEQLLELLDKMADACSGTGVRIAIEPLNRKESNIINSVAEGVYFARAINREPIRVLADFYHMDEEQEPLETITENRDWLAHIHVADTGRLAPGTGQYPYESFMAQLKAAGYNGRISAECTLRDKERELPASLEFLRRQCNA